MNRAPDNDAFAEILDGIRLTDSFYARCELRAPWGISFPQLSWASFHFVARGRCYLEVDSRNIEIPEGGVVFLPRGRPHALRDRPASATIPFDSLPSKKVGTRAAVLELGGSGQPSVLCCGGVHLQGPVVNPVLALLPEPIVLEAAQPWLEPTLSALSTEALTPRAGGPALLTRLADVVVLQIVRAWLEKPRESAASWLLGMRDPAIGRALALIHGAPERPWTVAELARAVHLSRAIFAARFAAAVGSPPVAYLTQWRMHVACELLRRHQLSVSEVCERVGYVSEAAFGRAFKRIVGAAPATFRRQEVA
jgi:AraC-like DNA-binding protein